MKIRVFDAKGTLAVALSLIAIILLVGALAPVDPSSFSVDENSRLAYVYSGQGVEGLTKRLAIRLISTARWNLTSGSTLTSPVAGQRVEVIRLPDPENKTKFEPYELVSHTNQFGFVLFRVPAGNYLVMTEYSLLGEPILKAAVNLTVGTESGGKRVQIAFNQVMLQPIALFSYDMDENGSIDPGEPIQILFRDPLSSIPESAQLLIADGSYRSRTKVEVRSARNMDEGLYVSATTEKPISITVLRARTILRMLAFWQSIQVSEIT